MSWAGHDCTREVRLPQAAADPLDLQVNYYDYRTRRLIPSTDVLLAGRTAYRTNLIGCRGDDLEPGRPVVAVFGGDFVHGPVEGGWVERLALPPFRVLNAGIEGLTGTQIVERFEEVNASAHLAAAIVAMEVPPAPEAGWAELLDRLAGPPLVAILPLQARAWGQASPAPDPEGDRFDRFLAGYCTGARRILVTPPPAPRAGWLQRLAAGRSQVPPNPLVAAVQSQLAAPLAEALRAEPGAAPGVAAVQGERTVAAGAEDVGRNYPLW